jgi:hypothetical protein
MQLHLFTSHHLAYDQITQVQAERSWSMCHFLQTARVDPIHMLLRATSTPLPLSYIVLASPATSPNIFKQLTTYTIVSKRLQHLNPTARSPCSKSKSSNSLSTSSSKPSLSSARLSSRLGRRSPNSKLPNTASLTAKKSPKSQPFHSQPFHSQPFKSQSFKSQSFKSQPFKSQSFKSQPPKSQPFQSLLQSQNHPQRSYSGVQRSEQVPRRGRLVASRRTGTDRAQE